MPKIAELREIDGHLWARLEEMTADQGQVTLWTPDEIRQHSESAVQDFLISLFHDWKRDR